MDRQVRTGGLACAVTLVAVIGAFAKPTDATAQWVDYPTANVPRNADGTPNLKAPAPRVAGRQARSVRPMVLGRGAARMRRPEGLHPADESADRSNNIGRTLKDGLPYTPWAAKLVAERTANGAKDDPHAFCLPPNFPRAYSLPQYIKIAQMPEAHDHPARVQRELPPDLHRRPAAAEGSVAGVERLLGRDIGKAIRSSSSRAVFATTCGSISRVAR